MKEESKNTVYEASEVKKLKLQIYFTAQLATFLFGIWFCAAQNLIAFWGEQWAIAAIFAYLYCQTHCCVSATSIVTHTPTAHEPEGVQLQKGKKNSLKSWM